MPGLFKIWSKSKDAIFRECLRKYYYLYLFNQNEQPFYEDEKFKELIELKKLKNRFLYRSIVLKNIIKLILTDLKYGYQNSVNYYISAGNNELIKLLQNKETSFEHKYGISDKIDYIQFYFEFGIMLENFFRSDIFKIIQSFNSASWNFIESDEQNNFGQAFNIFNHTIIGGPDLFIKKSKDLYLFSWLTGKKKLNTNTDADLTAAISYSTLKEHLGFEEGRYENIFIFIYYPALNNSVIYKTPEKINLLLENMKNYLKNSIASMSLADSNALEWFAKKSDKKLCEFCNFKGIC